MLIKDICIIQLYIIKINKHSQQNYTFAKQNIIYVNNNMYNLQFYCPIQQSQQQNKNKNIKMIKIPSKSTKQQKHQIHSNRSTNLPSQRAQMEYNVQHQCWDKLRQKMKSMQLNKIDVTTYLIKKRDNVNENGLQKVNQKIFAQSERSFRQGNISDGKERPEKQQISRQGLKFQVHLNNNIKHAKIYPSRDKQKIEEQKNKIIYAPYLTSVRKLQKIRPATQQTRINKQTEINQQNPESSPNIQQIQNNKQYKLPENCQKIIQSRQKKLSKRKKRTNTSVSFYKKNNNYEVNPSSTDFKINKGNSKHGKDLVQFSKIIDKDYVERIIVRRKTNIIGDYFQAFQAAILKGKIILFTVDITTGNISFLRETGSKSSSLVKNDIKSLKLQNNQRKITPTGSKQQKLMLGSCQIHQYLQLLSLSHHPLEAQNSITTLAIILVDFLKVTEIGLRIDKNQFLKFTKNAGLNRNSNLNLQEVFKANQQNKLIRWRTPHTKRNIRKPQRLSHQNNVINHNFDFQKNYQGNNHKDLEPQIQYFQAYGHPHPIINGQQSKLLVAEVQQQLNNISESFVNVDIEQHNENIQNSKNQINKEIKTLQQKMVQQKFQAITEKQQIISHPKQNGQIINKVQQNHSLAIQQISQNIGKINTISVGEEIINNQSKVLSKNQSIVVQAIIQ